MSLEGNILQASQIFKNKWWKDYYSYEDTKKRFHLLLSVLNDEQQRLMLSLLDRFTWIGSDISFNYEVLNLFNNKIGIDESLWKKFYIYPLKKEWESSKSSDDIVFKMKFLKRDPSLKEFWLYIVTKLDDFKNMDPKSKIILLDDYIWTWRTTIESIDSFMNNIKTPFVFNRNNLLVAALAGQEKWINKLKELWINVRVWRIYKKWISDYYEWKEKEKMIKIMESIEIMMNWKNKLNEMYFFWRHWSEWLISFQRAANNTFPAFWWNGNYDDWKNWPFTFVR